MTDVLVVGDIAVDVLVAPQVPVVPGADVPARIRTVAGGAGANTAAWLAGLGVRVTLAARVGDDPARPAAVVELACRRCPASAAAEACRYCRAVAAARACTHSPA